MAKVKIGAGEQKVTGLVVEETASGEFSITEARIAIDETSQAGANSSTVPDPDNSIGDSGNGRG